MYLGAVPVCKWVYNTVFAAVISQLLVGLQPWLNPFTTPTAPQALTLNRTCDFHVLHHMFVRLFVIGRSSFDDLKSRRRRTPQR